VTAGRARRVAGSAALAATVAALVAGCFNVQSPDLFQLTRTGQGATLTLLVNDSGTISCNGTKAKPISNSRLIAARDLSDSLATDATAKLTLPAEAGSVYYFRIRMQQGTISFPDRAAGAGHPNLAQAELFATQAAQQSCGLSG
jgi:hypothetical protein